MVAKSGIQVKRNAKGKATHIAIDLRKHPQAISILKESGLVPKSDFQKRCEKSLTVEQVRKSMHKLITDFYAKRNS